MVLGRYDDNGGQKSDYSTHTFLEGWCQMKENLGEKNAFKIRYKRMVSTHL